MKQTLLLLTSSIAMTCFANAATLIDFSNATAAGAGADSNGNYWTTIGNGNKGNAADVSVFNLIDSTNTATSIDLSVDFANNTASGWGGNGITGPAGSNPFDQSFATNDGIYSNTTAGVVTLTFSDLAVSTVYNLSLIGGRAVAGMDGPIAITTGSGLGGTLLNNGTQLDLAITSDALGVIAFTFIDTNASNLNSTTLNAMSITAVPEPSSAAALIGLCSLALVLRRRR